MIFRIARHTNNLSPIIDFYTKILRLEILGSFENHADYDGVFLGKPDINWHLEFTKSKVKTNHKFDEDDILVFYPVNKAEYTSIIAHIDKNNIAKIIPVNPYWRENGIMIADPDGYKIIVSDLKIR